MRELSLLWVSLARFRSFVEPTTFRLDVTAGLRLVTGTNLDEPRLGANGIGKSTVFDALCACLYGSSVRGLRPSELVSWGHKGFDLAVGLRIDGADRVVSRTFPPSRVSIDGERAEQDDVDYLVGLSRSRFLNSVVFGQAAPLFLDLPVPARGDLLDEVLDLELWMRAAGLAGDEHAARTSDLVALRTEMARVSGQLDGLPDVAVLRMQEQEWSEAHGERVLGLNTRLAAARRDHVALQRQARSAPGLADAAALQKGYDDLQRSRSTAAEDRAGVRARLGAAQEDHEFFRANDSCPSCGQAISDDLAHEHLEELTERITVMSVVLEDFDSVIEQADASLPGMRSAWQDAVRSNAALEREHRMLAGRIAERRRDVDALEAEHARLSAEVNPHAAQRRSVAASRRTLAADLAEKTERETGLIQEMASLEYWRGGFRKVRLFCLERVLRELEIESRNELAELGLVGWSVAFTTATETKSGTVKLGVRAEIRSPTRATSFDSMSPGEAQRARLSTSLGLGGLIQRWSGMRWADEVYDEPTNWLSEQGVEDLLETLASRASRQKKSVWLCDHRSLSAGAFSEVVQIVKDERGSRIQ